MQQKMEPLIKRLLQSTNRSRYYFQMTRMQAKTALVGIAGPIPASDVDINEAAGILSVANYRLRPAGRCNGRNFRGFILRIIHRPSSRLQTP
jgi:hypothetical protein